MSPRSVSILVHGASKVGKSTLVATAPKPLLYIDVEGGSRFLRLKKRAWDPSREAPPNCDDGSDWDTAVVTIRDYDELKLVFEWLKSGQHCFTSVAIDSVSELQQLLIDKVGNRLALDQRGWGDVFRKFSGDMRDFHKLTEHPTKPLDCVAFVAMSKDVGDGKYVPFAQGQSMVILPYIVDVLAAMEVITGADPATGEVFKAHRMTVGPHPRYMTGERVGGTIPPAIDNPNIPMILDYIYGPEPSSVPMAK